MHFVIVIYTACKSLATRWGLFLGTPPPPTSIWKGGRTIPPLDFLGGRIPPWNYKYLKKSNLCNFLMDSKDLYICESVKTYTILQK